MSADKRDTVFMQHKSGNAFYAGKDGIKWA